MKLGVFSKFKNQAKVSGIVNPEPWLVNAMGGLTSNGIRVTESSALGFAAYFAAVRVISGSLAVTPMSLYDRSTKAIALANQVHKLIHSAPGGFLTPYNYKRVMALQAIIHGRALAYIHRDGRFNPIRLEPLERSDVMIEKLSNGDLRYSVPKKGLTNVESFNMIDVLPYSLDGYAELTPLRLAAGAIALGTSSEDLQTTAYSKGLHTGGVLTLPPRMALTESDEEGNSTADALRNQFYTTYQGQENWHKVIVLEQGMNFQYLTMPLKDAELIATRNFQVLEIARFFGVPPHKLAHLDKMTTGNIEQQNIEYVQDAVLPLAKSFEEEHLQKLIPEADQTRFYIKVNLSALMRGDTKNRADYYAQALGSRAPAWMTQNEVRELEDLPPVEVEGADRLNVPKNMSTTEATE